MSERTSKQPGAPALRSGVAAPSAGSAALALVGDVAAADPDTEGGAFSGAPGRLLAQLLAAAGIDLGDVFVTGVLERAPTGNREPRPGEIAAGQQRVNDELAIVGPRVVCAVGSAASRALGGGPTDLGARHGRATVQVIGEHTVYLLALHHPASALYTPGVAELLRRDIAGLPELLARPRPGRPAETAVRREEGSSKEAEPPGDDGPPEPPSAELRLF